MGSFVNFLLVIFKFLAGIAGHSAAMLADAVQMCIRDSSIAGHGSGHGSVQ